jgi:hypothetical protein
MSKCSKWREKWPKVSHKSLKERGEMAIGTANRVVVAIIRRLQSKTQRRWDSILAKVAHQDSKMIRKRIKLLTRVPGKSLIKPII